MTHGEQVLDIGLDLGTTVTKLTALAEDGTTVVSLSTATTWEEPGDGCAEQSPGAVVGAVDDLLARAATAVGTGTSRGRTAVFRSVGLTSLAESGVLVDADGQSRSPVIAWFDPRGSHQVASLTTDFRSAFSARTGLKVSHVPTVFKLAWLRDNGLDLRGLQWLSLAELVIHHLGGRRVAERSLMGRTGLLDVHTGGVYQPSLSHLGVDEALVPELVWAGMPVGRVARSHPVEAVRGAVLTVAGHDHPVAAASAGSSATASAMDSIGTAEAFVVASRHVPDPAAVLALTDGGISVHPHVVKGTTALLCGMRTGLVLKRVLCLLGAEGEAERARLDRAALDLGIGSASDILVSGFAMSDSDVVVHLGSDSPTPVKVWRAALDHSTDHAAARLAHLSAAGVPIERLVLAGGWSGMASVVDARRALAPVVEVATLPQPGPRGAALFGRWAATAPEDPDGDGRPPAEYFTAADGQPAP